MEIDLTPVPGVVDAYATPDGRIFQEMRPFNRVRGYHGVSIKGKAYLWHRLILLAFSGEPTADKNEAMHLNNNRTDNHASNLRWGSHSENMEMDRGNNHAHSGEQNPNRKISWENVLEIRHAYDGRSEFHWGRRNLSKKFGISETTALQIAERKIWKTKA